MVLQLGKLTEIELDTRYKYQYYIITYIDGLHDKYVCNRSSFDNYTDLKNAYTNMLNALEGHIKWINTVGGAFRTKDIKQFAPVVAYNIPEDEEDDSAFRDCADFTLVDGSDGIRMNFSHVKYVPIDFR